MMSLPDFRYKQIVVHVAGGSGERLRFRADNIVLEDREGTVLLQHSCHRLFALFVIGEVSLTSVLIRQCSAFGFPIVLLGRNMRPVANIRCGAEGNTLLRMKQYAAGDEWNLRIAKELVRQKIGNQARLLKSVRHLSSGDRDALASLSELDVDAARSAKELMGLEGTASRLFFSSYFRPLGWQRREPRCKPDIPNLLLDIGYTYLFQFVAALLSLYGFDLYCGVFHRFFYQRMSLVCDIVEPFRCIVDRRLRKAHNLGQIDEGDFFVRDGTWNLGWKQQARYTRLFSRTSSPKRKPCSCFANVITGGSSADGRSGIFPFTAWESRHVSRRLRHRKRQVADPFRQIPETLRGPDAVFGVPNRKQQPHPGKYVA